MSEPVILLGFFPQVVSGCRPRTIQSQGEWTLMRFSLWNAPSAAEMKWNEILQSVSSTCSLSTSSQTESSPSVDRGSQKQKPKKQQVEDHDRSAEGWVDKTSPVEADRQRRMVNMLSVCLGDLSGSQCGVFFWDSADQITLLFGWSYTWVCFLEALHVPPAD